MKLKVIFQTSIFGFHVEVSRVYTRKGWSSNLSYFSGDMLVFGEVRSIIIISASVFRLPNRNKHEQLALWTLMEFLHSYENEKKHDQLKSVHFFNHSRNLANIHLSLWILENLFSCETLTGGVSTTYCVTW